MKTERITVNGQEEEIVISLEDDYKEKNVIEDINLENTLELNINMNNQNE